MYSKSKGGLSRPHIMNIQLFSPFNYGDRVVVYLGNAGIIKNCTIIKIHFPPNKVSYDLEVSWTPSPGGKVCKDRLYNIDSINVHPESQYEALQDTRIIADDFRLHLKAAIFGRLKDSRLQRFALTGSNGAYESAEDSFFNSFDDIKIAELLPLND